MADGKVDNWSDFYKKLEGAKEEEAKPIVIHVHVNLDGKELAEAVVKHIPEILGESVR